MVSYRGRDIEFRYPDNWRVSEERDSIAIGPDNGFVSGSLAYGMLTGAFHAGMRFDESDWRSRGGNLGVINLARALFGPEHFPRNLKVVDEIKTLATGYHKTLPQFALRWTLSNSAVSTALVGFRQPAEVEENLGALGWTITPADMAAIDEIFARHAAMTMPPGWLEDE